MSSFKSMKLFQSQVQGYPASIVVVSSPNSKVSYQLNMVALESLMKNPEIINKEVVLISISGAFRKGKSFMLNLFVAYLEWLTSGKEEKWLEPNTPMDNFHYRAGSKPDTNGIIMWSKPYILTGRDGKEYAVFLMDTQGTFDHNSTVKDCASIFAMSTLLSSVQIFNLDKQIQGDDLNNLRLFTEYAQLVKNGEAAFQKLLFLIRDWENSDEHDYGLEGGKEYLEEILQTQNLPKENREARQNLQKSFESLEACLMPYPGENVASNNSKTILGKINKDFGNALEEFIPHLFSSENLVGKRVGGHQTTCGELAELFKTYMAVFNSDELPEPKSILEATAEAINISAEQAAKEKYDELMRSAAHQDLCDLEQLKAAQKLAMTEALEKFEARPKIGGLSGEENMKALEKHFKTCYAQFKKSVEQNIKSLEEKRRLEEERRQLENERKEERTKRIAMEQALQKHLDEQKNFEKKHQEEMKKQKEELEKKTQELKDAMTMQNEEQQKQIRELKEALEKQAKEREEKYRKEKEALEKKTEKINEEMKIERPRDDVNKETKIIGKFSQAFDTYEVVSNFEIHNRSRYLLKFNSINLHRGVVEIPPTDIGPNEILRCGFHKTNYSWWGCGGVVGWKYSPDKKNSYDVILTFETIWKSAIYQHPNMIEIKLSSKEGSIDKKGEGSNPITVENHVISVTAATGDTNHTTIRVTIHNADEQ